MADDTYEERQAFQEFLNGLFEDVDREAYERHEAGAQQYGALKFLGADTLQEALAEVLDLINYARYTAVKLKILQMHVAQEAAAHGATDTTGSTFVTTSDLLQKGFDK